MSKRKKNFKLPNNFGSIYKLSGNRRKPWVVSKSYGYNDKGNIIRKVLGYFGDHDEAMKFLLEFNNMEFEDYQMIDLKFKDAFSKWYNMVEAENEISEANRSVYYSIFKNHCTSLYDIKILDLKTIDVQKCIDSCSKGFNTKRYIKLIASQVYKYCFVQLDMPIKKNFSEGLKIGKKEKSTIHSPFTNDEIKLLWDNIDIPYVNAILISIYEGLRPSELLKIEISNIFIDDQYMVGGIKTEAGIDRIMPIHDNVLPLIKELIKNNNKYLIERSGLPIPYRRYEELFKNIMIKLNLEHKPHDGRHTLATEFDNIGANDVCVKLILGHKINDITKGVYTHKNKNQLLETINLAYKNIC